MSLFLTLQSNSKTHHINKIQFKRGYYDSTANRGKFLFWAALL